jgi:four helix bundle protein
MFLQLDHKKLEIVSVSKQLVIELYKLTRLLPSEEKYAMASQLRRAALSIYLNITEGFSRRSALERKRFFEIARGSLIEAEAALEIALELGFITKKDLECLGPKLISCFKLLSKLITNTK